MSSPVQLKISTKALSCNVLRGDSQLFEHTPLEDAVDQIRLLQLEPGGGNDEIVCYIHHHYRASLPQYEAISYTWGDVLPSRGVSINETYLEVRENCYYAL